MCQELTKIVKNYAVSRGVIYAFFYDDFLKF
jgi:hypothetical protein